jgi:uncharacterized protein DUF4386
MHPTVKGARIAGALYLSTLPIALYCWSYIPGKLIVRGNATATAENVLAHETLFRVSILGDLVGHVIFICVGFALYRLLRDVNRTWAVAMLGLNLVQGAIGFSNALNSIAAVVLFRSSDFLAIIDKAQRDALAMFFIRLHGQGFVINEIFWGVWLLPLGLLVFRSRFLPRFLGIWLIVACFAWLVLSVSELVYPGSSVSASKPLQLVALGETAFALWLLVRGVNVKRLSPEHAIAAGKV